MTETKLLLTISNNIKLASNETNKKFKVHHLCYTCIHFCLFVCLFCLFKMIKKLWTTQAASLHKLEAESSAAGRKLEEAVARGGEKPLLSIRGIFHFVSWRKVVITTNGLLCCGRFDEQLIGWVWKCCNQLFTLWVDWISLSEWPWSQRMHSKMLWLSSQTLNPLHPNISVDILHTVLCTFPKVLTRRICLTVKPSCGW